MPGNQNNDVPDWPNWEPELHATLMFVRQGSRVLLIEKLTGIGMGKINGPGGKIDPGEKPGSVSFVNVRKSCTSLVLIL